jgi:hypothetical protein
MTLSSDIQAAAALYPDRRSAILPALRLAQERHGWLSPEALRDVADALDYTPAYCLSVASFYDMFHLEPVGAHVVEVCTNICCGLRGAQDVVESFENALGCPLRRDDGGRQRHLAGGGVPRRLRMADRRRRRRPLPPERERGGRGRDRRGGARWLRSSSSSSPAPTSTT